MIKIGFDITEVPDREWIQIEKHITSLDADYVLTENQGKANLVTSILATAGIKFSVEELKLDDVPQEDRKK